MVRRCFGGALHIYRTKFLWKNACQELVEIHNYGLGPASVELLLEFAADFAERFVEGQVSLLGDAADNQALLGLEAICGLLRTKQTPRRPSSPVKNSTTMCGQTYASVRPQSLNFP